MLMIDILTICQNLRFFSALYVVDLDRFRQIAAGDRLRQHYQGLSADPNSLANLDQDLPNNMYNTLPIVSGHLSISSSTTDLYGLTISTLSTNRGCGT